jgi:hypothetical protein
MKEKEREFMGFNGQIPMKTWELLKFMSIRQHRSMMDIIVEAVEKNRKKFEESY